MTFAQLTRELAWMSQDTLVGMRERGSAGCQHVLPVIQWVGRAPESFTVDGASVEGALLPDPAPGRWRWYWDMTELNEALEAQRAARGMTWADVAAALGTTLAEIKSVQRAKYGT